MGKKGKRNKSSSILQSQPPSLVAPPSPSSSELFSYVGKNKVAPQITTNSEIPFAAVDKKRKGEIAVPMNDQSLMKKLCSSSNEEQLLDKEVENVKTSKKRKKKQRQKVKKLARKMTIERRESELSLGDFLNDNQGLTPQVKISLCRSPLTTLEYFFREIPCLLCDVRKRYVASRRQRNKALVTLLEIFSIMIIFATVLMIAYFWMTCKGPLSLQIKQYISWYFYWVFLGILSSVGLGTGLHTFILYLGPFVAKISLAAQECSSLDFPQPPYPNQIICPSDIAKGHSETPAMWAIATKVRWETLAWGFGTAIGELPPYFIARAASLTGSNSSSDLEDQDSLLAKIQLKMKNFVMKVGFWGILLCASIPNPLFDLAGITCGHFHVPFATFFGATAIGKTIVKSQLQMILVLLAFNEKSLERVLITVGSIPRVGSWLQKAFTDFMNYQRAALHSKETSQSGGILRILTEIIVIVMILYFLGSIVTGMAKSYHKRINRKREKRMNKTKKRLKKKLPSPLSY